MSKAQHKALANFSKKKKCLIFNFSHNIFVHLLMSILSFNQEMLIFITLNFIENSSIDKSRTKKTFQSIYTDIK